MKKTYHNLKNKLLETFGHLFFMDLISIILIVTTLLILFLIFVLLIFRLKSGDGLVPIVYNHLYGVTSAVTWYKLYFLPITYLIFSVLNVAIAWAFFEKERLISYLVLSTNIIIGLIMTVLVYNLTVLIRS